MSFAKKLIEKDEEPGRVLAENFRRALPAIALDSYMVLSATYMNDCELLLFFAQQVNGYYRGEVNVFFGIFTIGNSKKVLYAAVTAHAKEMKVIDLEGDRNSKLDQMSDVYIKVPQIETYMIQKLYLLVYHMLDVEREVLE